MSKTKPRIPKVVLDAVHAYAKKMSIPPGQYGILLNLAIRSYKNMSLDEREKWTLEQVMIQGL